MLLTGCVSADTGSEFAVSYGGQIYSAGDENIGDIDFTNENGDESADTTDEYSDGMSEGGIEEFAGNGDSMTADGQHSTSGSHSNQGGDRQLASDGGASLANNHSGPRIDYSTDYSYEEGIVVEMGSTSFVIETEYDERYYCMVNNSSDIDVDGSMHIGTGVYVFYDELDDNDNIPVVACQEDPDIMYCDRGAYEFALKVRNYITYKDKAGLASLCSYPFFYMTDTDEETGHQLNSKEDFIALSDDLVFSEEFMMLAETNICYLENTDEGIKLEDPTGYSFFRFINNGSGYEINSILNY